MGPIASYELGSSLYEEEEDSAIEVPPSSEPSNLFSGMGEQTIDLAALCPQLQDTNKGDQNISKDIEIPTKKDNDDMIVKHQEYKAPLNFQPSVFGGQQQIGLDSLPDVDVQQRQHLGQQSVKVATSLVDGPTSYLAKNASKTELPKFKGFGSGPAFAGKITPDSSQSNCNDLRKNIDPTKESPPKIRSTVFHGIQSQSGLSGKNLVPEGSQAIPSSLSSTWNQGNRFASSGSSFVASNVSTDLTGKHSVMVTTAMSSSASLSAKPTQIVGQRASSGALAIESFPSIRSSHLSSQESFTSGSSPIHQTLYSKKDFKAPAIMHSAPNVSRQFFNVSS